MVVYEALVLGFKAIINLVINNLKFYDDSQLFINQINDAYNKKDENLQPKKYLVDSMIQRCFLHIQFENISKNNNKFADVMANIASLIPISVEDEETIIKINNL